MAFEASKCALASERSIFSKNHDYNIYKSFPCSGEHVPIFRGLDARGGRKLRTDTHTHTRGTTMHSNDNNTLRTYMIAARQAYNSPCIIPFHPCYLQSLLLARYLQAVKVVTAYIQFVCSSALLP